MLKNYIKIALRNIRKYKGYSLINIFGLAIGIAVCVLIYRYVSYELSYDTYHSKSDRIYRVTLDHPQAKIAVTPSMILPTMKRIFPEVQTGVRIYDVGKFQPLVIRYEDRVFEERKLAYADSTLFEVFDFKMISGNPETALARPNTVVINHQTARKYFSDENPIGKSLEINGSDFEVTGVIQDIPENSHFSYDFFPSLVSRQGWSQLDDEAWRAANFYTYLVLEQQASPQALTQKADSFIETNFPENDFAASLSIKFQPLTDIHLYSDVEAEIAPQGDIRYVVSASAIALLILLIACINYMNLATARSARRSREVGIRKVLGSERGSLVRQFYGESAFLTLIAIICSILLIELFLPWFNSLTGQTLDFNYFSWQFWGVLFGIGLVVTLLAGSYPALMLSSFKPAAVLKGDQVTGGSAGLRRALVVLQFSASIFLIICTIVIYNQINFIQEKELGYKKDNVLVLTSFRNVDSRFEALRSELMKLPGVKGAALVSETPTNIRAGYGPDVEGVEESSNFVAQALRTTPGFTEALNIELVAGRSFTQGDFVRANQDDNREYAIMVNEAAAAHYGLEPEEMLGRQTRIGGRSGPIVGVIKDFHFASLHRPIAPLFLFPQGGFNKLLVSFETGDVSETLEKTRNVWASMFPQYPFEYEFLDQEYNALYRQEERAGNVFTSFSVLAVLIACLGLVGLASYMVERRTKEIGVRKVLGATAAQVMALFSKDFLLLIGIGFLISVPVAWYTMAQWLQNFAYRINIQWTSFLLAGFITALFALLTVSYQAIRAARLDPVNSLKTE